MPEIFVDTAGWGHLVDATQEFHSLAATLYRDARQQGRTFITSNYIIAEIVALLTSPLQIPRQEIIAFIDGLKSSPYVEIIHVDVELDEQAWELLTQRQDKIWSLVDCSSFVIMQERGLTDALTSDHHFEQAGFRCMLKPDQRSG